MSTMLYTGARIPRGRVTVRQIASLYVYENYLYTVEMTGARLRAALEHAASLYQPWPVPSGEQMRLPDFNVDSAAGVSYTIDLRQPSGHRIADLTYKSKPLNDAQELRVAISNYRYTGGGGYDFKGLPIVHRSSEEIRELIIEHLTRTGVIPTVMNHNWRIVPQEAVDALRRAAVAQEEHATSSSLTLSPGTFLFTFSLPQARVRGALLPRLEQHFYAPEGN